MKLLNILSLLVSSVSVNAFAPTVYGSGGDGTITFTLEFGDGWSYADCFFSEISTGDDSVGSYGISSFFYKPYYNTHVVTLKQQSDYVTVAYKPSSSVATVSNTDTVTATYDTIEARLGKTEFLAAYTYVTSIDEVSTFSGIATVTVDGGDPLPTGPVTPELHGNFTEGKHIEWFYTIPAPLYWSDLTLDFLTAGINPVQDIEIISGQDYKLDWTPASYQVNITGGACYIEEDLVIKITTSYTAIQDEYPAYGALYLSGSTEYLWTASFLKYADKSVYDSEDLSEDASLSTSGSDSVYASIVSAYTAGYDDAAVTRNVTSATTSTSASSITTISSVISSVVSSKSSTSSSNKTSIESISSGAAQKTQFAPFFITIFCTFLFL